MHKVNITDIDHYYCNILDFNTGTCQIYWDESTSELSRLPDNVLYDTSNQTTEKKKKIRNENIRYYCAHVKYIYRYSYIQKLWIFCWKICLQRYEKYKIKSWQFQLFQGLFTNESASL